MFWRRGHREITVFVPQWRQKRDRLTTGAVADDTLKSFHSCFAHEAPRVQSYLDVQYTVECSVENARGEKKLFS